MQGMSRNDRVLASLGAPPSSVQTSVLKSVASSGLLGVVAHETIPSMEVRVE